MHLLRSTTCVLVLYLVTTCSGSIHTQFSSIDTKIEVFKPKGIRVSIPDTPDLNPFSFNGAITKRQGRIVYEGLPVGNFKKIGDFWNFENSSVFLDIGDELFYKLVIIKNHLGYDLALQHYTVDTVYPEPSGLFSEVDNKNPSETQLIHTENRHQKTTVSPYLSFGLKPVLINRPEDSNSNSCNCPNLVHLPPTVFITTCQVLTTTQRPTTPNPMAGILGQLTQTIDLNKELKKQLQTANDMNDFLIRTVKNTSDPNLTTLNMSGRIPTNDDPLSFVKTVLKEKLKLKDNVQSAWRNSDNTISFNMETYEAKLNIIVESDFRLFNSKIIIKDAMCPNCN